MAQSVRDLQSGVDAVNDQSERFQSLRDTVRRAMGDFPPTYWLENDQRGTFPAAFFEMAAAAGFLGALIDREYGGSAAGPAAASVIVEEVNRAGGDATSLNAQMTICGSILRGGTERQKRRYLPRVANGSLKFLSVAATEPDSGADMSALKSTSRLDGDDWVLNASKVFISMAEHTDAFILLTKSAAGPTLFVLDLEQVGDAVDVRPIATITNRMTTSLFIEDLRVPDACRLGEEGNGTAILGRGFALRRCMAAAECVGNARFLLERSLENVRTRCTFGRPIGQNQGVQYPLATAYTHVEAADLMRWDALARIEAGEDADARSALAKLLASEAAWETVRAAMTGFGGWGLAEEVHIERKLRENTVFLFNNMLLSYVAERVLNLPKAF